MTVEREKEKRCKLVSQKVILVVFKAISKVFDPGANGCFRVRSKLQNFSGKFKKIVLVSEKTSEKIFCIFCIRKVTSKRGVKGVLLFISLNQVLKQHSVG